MILARLFRRKSRTVVIAGSSLSSSCKNFNVAHYSKKVLEVSTPNLEYLLIMTSMRLQDKGHNSESYSFELCPFLTKPFK